ncbi:hypothetical protein CAG54_14300 [Vibrio sp. V27_P1S3P104]|nr:hypothetical protein [Vibrio sp. V28_P6S34P95]NAX06328.1 hypothetical protein [Vibrio sp. V30_P3S12P165]NAX33481.1 hypothetical protein [Vibrio sp. V29_P1S30P107]NAX38675.1 hypothetical protein [Vibrio sp. V27_P1S3P104]NAX39402.1 hypothetical protein [Vibrio sp. V26_P1S5P106]
MALTKGQSTAVQIYSRQMCHSLAVYLQFQVVWGTLKQIDFRISKVMRVTLIGLSP